MISFGAHRAVTIAAGLGIFGILGAKSVKADFLTPPPSVLLGTTSAVIGLTPIQDSTDGFGRAFLGYTLNANYNASVYWIPSLSGQPFTVDNGEFTFTPGEYTNTDSEWLVISPDQTGGIDDFSLYAAGALFQFALPSTVAPSLNSTYTSLGGDEYYLFGVPTTVYSAALPEPNSLQALGVGCGLTATLLCFTRLRKRRKERRDS